MKAALTKTFEMGEKVVDRVFLQGVQEVVHLFGFMQPLLPSSTNQTFPSRPPQTSSTSSEDCS